MLTNAWMARILGMAFMIGVGSAGGWLEAGDGTIGLQRFWKQAPAAWDKLRSSLRENIEITVDTTFGGRSDEAFAVTISDDSWRERRLIRLANACQFVQRSGNATGINTRYSFQASEDGAGHWLVTKLGQRATQTDRQQILKEALILFMGLHVEGFWVGDLVQTEGFSIQKIEGGTSEGGNELYRMSFKSHASPDDHNMILGGVLLFDPARFWVITEYQVSVQSTTLGAARMRTEYSEIDGLPIPLRSQVDYKFERDPPIRYVYTFHDAKRTEFNADKFRLSVLGLPEPGLPGDPSTSERLFVWLNVAGIVCLIVGILIRRIGKRRHASSTGSL